MSHSILDLFARSPLTPLQAHMDVVNECANNLLPFFKAVLAEQWDDVLRTRKTIITLEHKADTLKIKIKTRIPRNLFLPVPRYEVLDLVSQQDNIANLSKDITGLIIGRNMVIPKTLHAAFLAYLSSALQAITQANKVVHELDELLEAGFKGREVNYVEKMVTELNGIETTNDKLQITLRKHIFDIEHELNPIDTIFLYKIVDKIGILADDAQRVGFRLMMLTSS